MIVSWNTICSVFALLFVSESLVSVSSHDLCTRSLLDNGTFIAIKSFDLRKATLMAWNSIADYTINDFLRTYLGVVILVHDYKEFYNLTAKNTEQYIFFVQNSHEYDIFLHTLINEDQVTPVRIIVILLEGDEDNYNQIIFNITLSSFKNDVTDIVILNCNDKKSVQIITYFPYLNEEQCKNTNPYLLNVNNKLTEYFPRKFKNFHGCSIRTSVPDMESIMKLSKRYGAIFEVADAETKLAKLLAHVLNATSNLTAAIFQGALVQGCWTGSVGDLVDKRTDISITGAFISHERFQVTQLTYSYKIQKIIWCTPQRREIHIWAKAVMPLLTDSTILLGVVSVLILIVSNIARKIEFEQNDLHESTSLLWYWAIFLGQEVRCETKSFIINSMFTMMLGLCLILRIAYQGELLTYLYRQTLEPPYTTLSEAIAGVNAYGGFQSMVPIYNDPNFSQKYQNLTLPQIFIWLEEITKGKRLMVTITQSAMFELVYAPKVQTVGEASFSAPVGVLVRKRWSAAKEISQAMMRITEAGFHDKILKDRQETFRLIVAKTTVSRDKLQCNAIGWYTLGACFYGLIIGWLISFTVLLFENVWYKMATKQ